MVLNSTIFVNVDADTVATFNEFFSRLVGNDNSNFTSECNRLFEIGQIEKLIDRYLEHIDSIFNLDSENGILRYFQFNIKIGIDYTSSRLNIRY